LAAGGGNVGKGAGAADDARIELGLGGPVVGCVDHAEARGIDDAQGVALDHG
jgi:hypothetical protein